MNLLLLAPGYQTISTTPNANTFCSVGLLLCFFLAVFVFLALFPAVLFSPAGVISDITCHLILSMVTKQQSPKKRPLPEAALGP